MKTDCGVIRDLLPLYADDACSEASRQAVDEHLEECPDCRALLGRLQNRTIEKDLESERDDVIRTQAKRFRTRSAAIGAVVACIFAVPVLVCLIVNLVSGAALDWFFIVLASLAVAASLSIVPLMVTENKALWTLGAFTASLLVLLAVCCLYSRGTWFWIAASAVLFGLGLIFLPFVVRAKPLQPWIGGLRKPMLVAAADVILFANLMNMVSLHTKGALGTVLLAALCVAAAVLLGYLIKAKKEGTNHE